jgi:hypothetical protein
MKYIMLFILLFPISGFSEVEQNDSCEPEPYMQYLEVEYVSGLTDKYNELFNSMGPIVEVGAFTGSDNDAILKSTLKSGELRAVIDNIYLANAHFKTYQFDECYLPKLGVDAGLIELNLPRLKSCIAPECRDSYIAYEIIKIVSISLNEHMHICASELSPQIKRIKSEQKP